MKKRVFFVLLFLILASLLLSCGSDPTPRSPQRAVPSFLTVRLDQGGYGFTIRNSDSESHRVFVEFLTDRGRVWSEDYTVRANDIYHADGMRYSGDNREVKISWVAIIDWI